MKNQKGMSLIALVIAIVLLVSLSMLVVKAMEASNGIKEKALQAKIETEQGAIKEELELNHQAYYIEKFTGEYSGDLVSYLEEKGFVNEDGVVNISTLLGKKGDKVSTGKGSDGKNIYKLEENENTDIFYYDDNGAVEQIGEISENI